MIIHCPHDAMVSVKELKPHPKNHNSHPKEQIERLAKILEYQGWRYPIKVSKRSGFITSGHGRLEAAREIGWKEVPVSFQSYESEEQEYADLQADNAIASWSALDLSAINRDLPDLGPGFDLDWLGIKDFTLDLSDKEEDLESIYTTKIEAPIYEPKGDKPKEAQLYDLSKTEKLLGRIQEAELPSEVKEFLKHAAARHTVFNYELIAEYYAHAPAEIQELMEDSALVIIDFKKAIEHGFVKLTQDLAEAYDNES